MLLSQLIKRAQKTLELYGDAPVFQIGEDGEHFPDFSFTIVDYGFNKDGKRITEYRIDADFPDWNENYDE